jgi:hypothetical protein
MTRTNTYVALSTNARTTNHDPAEEPLLPRPGSSRSTPYGGSVTVHPDGQGYTYTYGPGGLSGLIHNYFALGCAVFCSIGGLTFGYDQGPSRLLLVQIAE